MKKLAISFIFCIFALTSCSNKLDAIHAIEKEFPNSEIYHMHQMNRFIVIDSIGIYVVDVNIPFTSNIWDVQLIKKWQNQ